MSYLGPNYDLASWYMTWLDMRCISYVGMFMGESAISPVILFLLYILAKSCDSLLLYIFQVNMERQSRMGSSSLAFLMIDVVYRDTLNGRFLGIFVLFESRENIVLLC